MWNETRSPPILHLVGLSETCFKSTSIPREDCSVSNPHKANNVCNLQAVNRAVFLQPNLRPNILESW